MMKRMWCTILVGIMIISNIFVCIMKHLSFICDIVIISSVYDSIGARECKVICAFSIWVLTEVLFVFVVMLR